MAQALAFTYQYGECYGAKCVELTDGVSRKTSKDVGGFTQADVDAACEKYCKEATEQIVSQLEALNTELTAKEAEIEELKKQLEAKDADGGTAPDQDNHDNDVTVDPVPNTNEVKDPASEKKDDAPAPDPATETETKKEAGVENQNKA